MVWLADMLCLFAIAGAIFMGLRSAVICHSRLTEFSVSDFHALLFCPHSLRESPTFWSWVYPLTMGFILLSVMALIARLSWALDVGWDNSGERWATVWLLWHSVAAILIGFYHYGVIRIYRSYSSDQDMNGDNHAETD